MHIAHTMRMLVAMIMMNEVCGANEGDTHAGEERWSKGEKELSKMQTQPLPLHLNVAQLLLLLLLLAAVHKHTSVSARACIEY